MELHHGAKHILQLGLLNQLKNGVLMHSASDASALGERVSGAEGKKSF
jgi:hypothetical protein